jgi:rRNA maturation RNase YbeY
MKAIYNPKIKHHEGQFLADCQCGRSISFSTKDNALKIGVSLQNEMQRVVIHGVLHLCGFKDKEKTDVEIMRKMEEKALLLFPQK